jgi:hypothetical protein
MSVLTLATEQMTVFDDVLVAETFDTLKRDLALVRYNRINTLGWVRVWALSDGNPLQGPLWALDTAAADMRPSLVEFRSSLAEHLKHETVMQLVGNQGTEWQRLSITPWIYPEGTGLSLHIDGGSYTGAYVFFCHDQWRLQWGGWLIVLPPYQRAASRAAVDGDVEALDVERNVDRIGHGRIILPKPNRLVFLAGDAPHMVSRVDPNAGDHLRLSLGGFFHRESRHGTPVDRLLARGSRAASKIRTALPHGQARWGS